MRCVLVPGVNLPLTVGGLWGLGVLLAVPLFVCVSVPAVCHLLQCQQRNGTEGQVGSAPQRVPPALLPHSVLHRQSQKAPEPAAGVQS